ncbi:MAG: hypothetical protein FJ222_11425 [Lentisphaerae bacterium]|nr:hypothetical protein [Lentisphaerota bacterium]
MPQKVWKRRLLILALIALCVSSGMVAWRYYNNTYLPMKEAQPIIQKLSTGKREDISYACRAIRGYTGQYVPDGKGKTFKLFPIEDHKPLRGVGEAKVKQVMLNILATETNRNILSSVIIACQPDRGWVDLANDSEEARNIISDALGRYNSRTSGFMLRQDIEGRWEIVQFGIVD